MRIQTGSTNGRFLAVVCLLALPALARPARAEDVRARWSLGLGVGFESTLDDIRSNASTLRVKESFGGLPGDVSDDEIIVGTSDPRQDDLLSRETEVEDRQSYNFSLAYGLTSWLSLQLDLGYYKGDASNFDTFRIDKRFFDLNSDNFIDFNSERIETPSRDASVPISAGRLERVPLMMSAVFRFRKDSPFNPIVGAGVGWVFNDFEESDALRDLNDEILGGFRRTFAFTSNDVESIHNQQQILGRSGSIIGNTDCTGPANSPGGRTEAACAPDRVDDLMQEWEETDAVELRKLYEIFLPPEEVERLIDEARQSERASLLASANADFVPQRPFVTTHVEDGFAYQIIGGAEYHFNERWSAYVVGRYIVTDANVEIRISDNGNTVIDPVTGSRTRFQTDEARFVFLASENCVVGTESGPTRLDPCTNGPQKSPITQNQQPGLLSDQINVQGGKINLTSFTLGFGIRFTF